jgi:hypothetical protein
LTIYSKLFSPIIDPLSEVCRDEVSVFLSLLLNSSDFLVCILKAQIAMPASKIKPPITEIAVIADAPIGGADSEDSGTGFTGDVDVVVEDGSDDILDDASDVCDVDIAVVAETAETAEVDLGLVPTLVLVGGALETDDETA